MDGVGRAGTPRRGTLASRTLAGAEGRQGMARTPASCRKVAVHNHTVVVHNPERRMGTAGIPDMQAAQTGRAPPLAAAAVRLGREPAAAAAAVASDRGETPSARVEADSCAYRFLRKFADDRV